jgi:hypothetical protein
MKSQNNFSAIQFATLGLVASFLLIGVAFAAPIYRGSFTLPFDAHWGSTTLPAGDYLLGFKDVGSRAFLVVRETKSGRDVAFLPSVATNETTATGQSALLVATTGNQRVIYSLRLAELGEVFVYDFKAAREEVGEASRTQTVPIIAMKK